ncbi:DNA-directed RNA polymerase III subunit RPC7 [Ambystoma mexicanum]|uniref:DNA-directed RNA polymerase III subunit RPC7 n=1 Tax=Ambystoma mexicanum TaxID=8296 RepID=UPI0037E7DE33
MAGRGRGRGRASFTFDIQAIGFSKGETLPEVIYTPSPIFPPTDFKAMAPKTGEDEDYMLALKQEFRGTMKRTPYFISRKADDQRIERYSAKYSLEKAKELNEQWIPDWRRLPREMKPRKKIPKKAVEKKKKEKPIAPTTTVDILAKIEELEKKGDEDKSDEETEGKEKDKEEDEDEVEAEVYDEEEQEEENDYIASYFEDGDDFGGGSDDNMDEATY